MLRIFFISLCDNINSNAYETVYQDTYFIPSQMTIISSGEPNRARNNTLPKMRASIKCGWANGSGGIVTRANVRNVIGGWYIRANAILSRFQNFRLINRLPSPPLHTLPSFPFSSLHSLHALCRSLITDRTDNYRWICSPARLKASCEVSRQPLRGFTWKWREKSAGFRRAMPEAGLPAALRGNFVAARDRRWQSGGSRGLQLLQMTHRQLEDVRLLQLANVLAFGLRTIALSDLSICYILPLWNTH